MTTDTAALLQDVVNATVREIDPERIILFGSHARGEARSDSDLDLLVIERGPFGKGRSRRAEIRRIRRALWDIPIPLDILVYSLDEIAEWKDSANHIIARSLREGKTLYERR